jgi:glycosyltransferase involved in cell wall biosynthesis
MVRPGGGVVDSDGGAERAEMADGLADCVVVPESAAELVRERFGLGPGERLRIAYVAGPGDAAGTFDHWKEGRFDPRVPVIAYSTMFYTLVEKIDGEALILTEPANLPRLGDPRFRFVNVPRDRASRRVANRWANFDFSRRAGRELCAYAPHVALVGVDTPYWLMRAIPAATRVIVTAHNVYWPLGFKRTGLTDRLRRLPAQLALRRVSGVVGTSQECSRQVMEMGGGTSHSVLSETPQLLSRFFSEPRPVDDLRALLFLGRIEGNKGVFDLLSAFEALAPRFPDLTLRFAGRGSAEAELARRIANSPVAARISLLGLLDGEGVHRALDAADLLICPTQAVFPEGLALVVVEAAVHGVPTLLSSVVPAKELFPGACVEFNPVEDGALARALTALAQNPDKLRELRDNVARRRDIFLDRRRSWGSQLFRVLLA